MDIEPLVETTELKTGLLTDILSRHNSEVHFYFDPALDTFMLTFVSPNRPTVVHYVDDDSVALLVQPDDLEVVGLQIEGFRATFMPRHTNVAQAWRLSEAGIQLHEFGDLLIKFEESKIAMADAIVRAARDDFEQAAVPLLIPIPA
jgi:hypothetical protein